MATNVKSYTTGDKSQNFYLNQHNQFISFAATGNTQLTTHAVGEVESLVADPVRLDVQPTGGGELFSIVNTGTDPSITRRIKYLGTESAFVKFSASGTISGEQPAPVVPAVVKVSVTRVAGTGTATVASSAKMDLENTTGNSRDFHLSGVGTVEPNDEYAITVSNVDNTEGWILENVYCEAQIVPDAVSQEQYVPPGAPAPAPSGGVTALVINYLDSAHPSGEDWRAGASGTEVFPAAFTNPPAVVAQTTSTNPSETVAVYDVTNTEFKYYNPGPASSFQVNNIGEDNVAGYFTEWGWTYGSTDGKPVAITFTSSTVPTGTAGYHVIKANDINGQSWPTAPGLQVLTNSPNTTGSTIGIEMLATGTGKLLCFHGASSPLGLYMRYSTDVNNDGLTWSAPVAINPGVRAYYMNAIQLDSGGVCVVSHGQDSQDVTIAVTSSNAPTVPGDFTVFNNPFDTSNQCYYPIVGKLGNGTPYVLYFNNNLGEYRCAVANNVDGTSWPTTGVTVVTGALDGVSSTSFQRATTELVGGNPAVAYRIPSQTVKYIRCASPDGLTWTPSSSVTCIAPTNLPPAFTPSISIMMKVVQGIPSIAFGDITADQKQVYYIKANDALGVTWNQQIVQISGEVTTYTGMVGYQKLQVDPTTGGPRLLAVASGGTGHAINGQFFSWQDRIKSTMVLAAEPAP